MSKGVGGYKISKSYSSSSDMSTLIIVGNFDKPMKFVGAESKITKAYNSMRTHQDVLKFLQENNHE